MFISILRVCEIGMGKHLSIFGDVTVGEIGAIVVADVAITGAGDGGEIADFGCCVTRHITDAMAVVGHYLDGIGVIVVGRVGFKGGSELSDVFIDVFAMCDACNREFDIVTYALILWPDADMVAFVFDAEVLKFLDGCIRITATNHYLHL